jgi:hypothetical protein
MTEKKEPQKGQRDEQEEEAASDLELSEEIAEQVAGGKMWTATNPEG